MCIRYDNKIYWLSRAYWFNAGTCTIYEFVTVDGDVYEVEVGIKECLSDKVALEELI